MPFRVDSAALDRILRDARTFKKWMDRPVNEETLHAVWGLAKLGPTSANCSPARVYFVMSADAKNRLKPCLADGNVAQSMAAPVTAIIGYDGEFFERLPELFPFADARSWFAGNTELAARTAILNGSLQGAYFMLAARALGLDCGPMSGFDNAAVDREFFDGTKIKSNFLCNLGYGDRTDLHPRAPRLDFNDACRVL